MLFTGTLHLRNRFFEFELADCMRLKIGFTVPGLGTVHSVEKRHVIKQNQKSTE